MRAIQFLQQHPQIRIRVESLRPKIQQVLRGLNFHTDEVVVVFTTNTYISELHGRYLGDPSPTDILTFAEKGRVQIVISLDQAKKQAQERKISLNQEVLLLVLHGLLHYVGHDDLNRQEWCCMKQKEFEWIAKLL